MEKYILEANNFAKDINAIISRIDDEVLQGDIIKIARILDEFSDEDGLKVSIIEFNERLKTKIVKLLESLSESGGMVCWKAKMLEQDKKLINAREHSDANEI